MPAVLLWALVASAAPPEGLRPVAAPLDAPSQYAAHLEAAGRPPAQLACGPLAAEQLLLCYRVWEGTARRWVTAADLSAWKTDLDGLRAAVVGPAQQALSGIEQKPVEGMEGTFLQLRDGDGWAVALVLHSELVRARLGGGAVRIGVPAEGMALAWAPATPELDHVMAVGVREIYEAQPGGVTPVVLTWDGTRFAPLMEARPKAP